MGEGKRGDASFHAVSGAGSEKNQKEAVFVEAVLCFMGTGCFYLALHLGASERDSPASSIFQALHLLGPFPALAGPCRWLQSPATLINNCCPTWRLGLQRDRRVISLQAAAAPACRAKEAPVGSGCEDPAPFIVRDPHGSMCDTVPVSSPAIQRGEEGVPKATAEHPESRW